ncbi:MAG: leucyl aminopeptidase family protein [Rhodothermaceae bacterium]|nr:leucyl aminopeptidase family protein [Rhodothermaceae bacterium]
MKIRTTTKPDDLSGDLIVPVTPSMAPLDQNELLGTLTGGHQQRFLKDLDTGKGEVSITYNGNKRIIFLGLGDKPGFGSYYAVFRSFSRKHGKKPGKTISLFLDIPKADHTGLAEAAVNGLITGSYESGILKSGQGNGNGNAFGDPGTRLTVYSAHAGEKGFGNACNHGQVIAETQKRVMELINIPSNRKSPDFMIKWVQESARKYDYQVEVFDLERIRKEGMSALEAVNRGSEHPAVFIVIRYKGKKAGKAANIGLVGKGVLYDTGGLSIKPTSSMQFMKSDMSGAATVMGTMEAAARLKLPVSLMAVIPVTDNLIDSRSVKPGDVFSNDDDLAAQLTAAGSRCGERLWQMPLWEEYLDELGSDVADLRNLGTKPVGGAITAAKFLEQFIGSHPSWAHLDVAGTAFGDTEFGKQKNATGFGIRLLLTFIEDVVNKRAKHAY